MIWTEKQVLTIAFDFFTSAWGARGSFLVWSDAKIKIDYKFFDSKIFQTFTNQN